jgi:hypothetical protein
LLLRVGFGARSVDLWIGSLFFLPISIWVLSYDLHRFRSVSFLFRAFLSLFGVFWPLFCFSEEVASTARCGSFTRPLRVVLPSPPSLVVPGRLAFGPPPNYFMFLFCFHVLDIYLFSCFFFFFCFCNSANLFRACFAALRPLPGLSSRPHCNEPPCTGWLRLTCNWLFPCIICVFFYCILLLFSCIFIVFFFFACNKSCLNRLVLCVMLGPNLWVVDVNNILAFGSMRTNVSLGFSALSIKE